MAAVLYVFRMLVDDDIPLNAGCLKPIEVVIPEGGMLQPTRRPAWWRAMWKRPRHHQRHHRRAGADGRQPVHGEQLHLRQRQVPVLPKPSRVARERACLTTPGGLVGGPGSDGAGAHDQFAHDRSGGAGWRFPVRLESYEIPQRPPGGKGQWNGGHGGVRRLRFPGGP